MATTKDKVDSEGAVRLYLLYLEDPNKLRDEAEIQQATLAVLEAKDPIEKLKALGALERAAKVDEAPLRAGFIEHAKSWADAEGVPISAFRELRVSDETLREAGFDLPPSATRSREVTPA